MKTLDDLIPPATRCIDLLAPPFSGHLHPILALGRMLAKKLRGTHHQHARCVGAYHGGRAKGHCFAG